MFQPNSNSFWSKTCKLGKLVFLQGSEQYEYKYSVVYVQQLN